MAGVASRGSPDKYSAQVVSPVSPTSIFTTRVPLRLRFLAQQGGSIGAVWRSLAWKSGDVSCSKPGEAHWPELLSWHRMEGEAKSENEHITETKTKTDLTSVLIFIALGLPFGGQCLLANADLSISSFGSGPSEVA